MEHITSVQFWMGVSLGAAVGCLFAYLGYVLYESQKSAEDVDDRHKLVVHLNMPNGQKRTDTTPVKDVEDAQRRLNEYCFSYIDSAFVYDPTGDKRVLAKMDKHGRLISYGRLLNV